MRTIAITILVIITLYLAYIFLLPFGRPLVQPVATWWYGSDFVSDTTKAAARISDTVERCIFDDSRNIFVESFADLDVDKMIDKALNDTYPRFRLERPQRDPHFRILVNNRTHYWSFRERKFFAFRGDRWSLKQGLARKMCAYYQENPESFEKAFWERNGIRVEEGNFCCSLAMGDSDDT